MRGSSHLAVGITTGVLLSNMLQDPYARATTLAFCALGSILPDIDHPDSVVGRKLWPISWIINELFGHRGFIHSLVLAVAMMVAAYIWGNPVWVNLVIGWWTHLACDCVTIVGIPVFNHGSKDIRLPRALRIRTGSERETGLVQMYVVFALVFTIMTSL